MTGKGMRMEDFFAGVEQLEASLGEHTVRTPTFYREARCFTAVLPARIFELRRVLPDRRMVPAQVLPGIGGVHLTAFEYHDTDLGPYREFAVGILLNAPWFAAVPCYNILRQMLQGGFCTYIHHLPVTTEIARRGGIELYNYPKFLASIDFRDTDDEVVCTLAEGDDLICEVAGRKLPAGRSTVFKYFCNMYQYGQPQGAEFKVNARRSAMAPGMGNSRVSLGDAHPLALELDRLLVSTNPLVYIYVPDMQAILYGPEHLSLAAVALFMERGLGVSLKKLREVAPGEPADRG